MRRLGIVWMMMCVMLVAAGCGSKNVTDTYSFGRQVFRSADSEIVVMLPFELGLNPNLKETQDGYVLDAWAGMGQAVMLTVEAQHARTPVQILPTPEVKAASDARALAAANGAANAKTETTDIVIGNVPMRKTVTMLTKQSNSFTIVQYVFEDRNVLWSVAYQYRTNEAEGKEIVDRIADNIEVTGR